VDCEDEVREPIFKVGTPPWSAENWFSRVDARRELGEERGQVNVAGAELGRWDRSALERTTGDAR
jgi:hypothetical protein